MDLEKCIEEGYIKRTPLNRKEIEKEMKECKNDAGTAEISLKENNYKWCIIQCYYSMFHSAKAMMISFGYKERRHFAVGVFLDHLVKKKKLESSFLHDFKAAMFAREEADYNSAYSKERAEQLIAAAHEFNKRMQKLLTL